MASTQTRVYIPDAAAVWLPAEIISVGTDGLLSVDAVYADDDEDEDAAQKKRVEGMDVSKMPGVDGKGVDALPMQNEAGSPEGAADMCSLGYLHEAAVLYNLRRRYFRELPYTYTGAMCIAINPYQWLERLYRDDIRAEYLARPRAELPPHVYAVSAAAYRGVAELEAGSGKWRGTDQAILVSGESGAGKTETVKIMMRHLASVASVDDGDLDAVDSVVARVLRSQPLLESFGNAKTVRNDNSSRFGKFTQLEFACSRGGKIALVGSRCRTYLLEKSRVVNQAEGERTYHCFYGVARAHPELLVGGLGLDVLTYTRESDLETERIEGVLDADRFATTWEALAIVGVDAESCAALSTLLAAALSLGEVRFAATDASDDNSPSAINGDDAAAALCAAALGIRADAGGATAVELLVKGLTERTMRARAEVYKVPLNAAQASDGRDALAKELYVRAFDWIVARINLSTASVGVDTRVVGLLDIFGFESFAVNRFEQICINYTNEKLQQKFTMDLFKTVQHEYDDERVPWKHVAFPDNAAVLTLIEGRMGVIDVLNEECVRPKGSDEGFVSKLKTLHGGGSDAKEGKLIPHRMRKDQFTVRHYAGDVLYTAEKWLERNADTLQDDLAQLARASDHVLIRQLFDVSHDAPAKGKEKRRGGALNADTVTTKFKAQLASLIDEVEKTEVQYVRCLKPNKLKSKRHYDANMVVEQLRCAGVIEAVRVARAGYPNKLPHAEFVRRFACLAAAPAAAAKGAPAGLAKELVGLPVTDESQGSGLYAMGLTRVYFKAGALEDLERRRSAALALKLVVAQAAYRRHYALKRFVALRRGATLLAAVARRNAAEARYDKFLFAVVALQGAHRRKAAVARVCALRRTCSATRIAAAARRAARRLAYLALRRAATAVAARCRRGRAGRAYRLALAEAKDQAKLENQLEVMQQRLLAMEVANQEAMRVMAEKMTLSAAGAAPGPAEAAPPPPPPSDAAMSADVVQLLQQLRKENERLRKDNSQLKSDSAALKQRVSELEQAQSLKLDWLTATRQQLSAGAVAAAASTAAAANSTLNMNRQKASAAAEGDDAQPAGRRVARPPRKATFDGSEATPRKDYKTVKSSRLGAVMASLGFAATPEPKAAAPCAPGAEESPQRRRAPHISLPLNRFWQDLPATSLEATIPRDQAGFSLIHLKVGGQYLRATGAVDACTDAAQAAHAESGGSALKTATAALDASGQDLCYLRCEGPAVSDSAAETGGDAAKHRGYRTAMAFRVERVDADGAPEKSLIADAPGAFPRPRAGANTERFRLRSEHTGGYVCVGGLFQRYCLLANAVTASDATTFEFVCRRRADDGGSMADLMAAPADDGDSPSDSMEHLRAKQLLVALRVVDGPKPGHFVRVRPDGYVNVAPPAAGGNALQRSLAPDDKLTPLLSVELLVPLHSYEITFHASQLGLIVSKTMPLRVVRFKDAGAGAPTAELSGRIGVGDVLSTADGRDLTNCSRREAVDFITSSRPITIGFKVAGADAPQKAPEQLLDFLS